jgi:flagellar biosynthesis/type III secretory pathway chaperone
VPDRPAARLGEILAAETREFRRLLTLLGNEQRALRVADAATVMTSLRAQEATLSRIRILENERASVLGTLAAPLGLDPAALTVSRLLEAWPEAAAGLGAAREELRALLTEVRHVNERNSVLVSRGLGYVDRLIGYLTSALAPEQAPAYGAQGRPASVSSLGLVDRTA